MSTPSMIKYETVFESTQNLPMVLALGHGENADLVAGITDNGIEVDLTDYTARAIYQPSSKFGTDDWYECQCEKVGNTVVVHWGHTYDNGDNAVIMWLHFLKDGKVAYPALYKIKLFETPGFTPSAIEPIPEVIDFSEYTLLNAPWALLSDFNVLSGNVDVLSGNVNALSTFVDNINYTKRHIVYGGGNIPTVNNREILAIDYGTVSHSGIIPVITVGLPDWDANNITDFEVNIRNKTNNPIRVFFSPHSWVEPDGTYRWYVSPYEGEPSANEMSHIEGNTTATFHFTEANLVTRNSTGNWRVLMMSRPFYGLKLLSADVDTLSGTVGTLSGNVNTLSTAIGNTDLLVKRTSDGVVGASRDIKYLELYGVSDAQAVIQIDDTASGGDRFVLCAEGPAGQGGEWHTVYLPNLGGVLVVDSQLLELSGNVNTLSGNVNTLSGNVSTLSGNVNTISGTVETLSGNVNTLSTSTLKTSQLITSITSASTDLEVPTGKAVYDAIQEGGGGGGGFPGYTVTFANDYSEHYTNYQVVTAPVRFIKADGTSEVIDMKNAFTLRGRTIQNVIMLASGLWTGEESFRPTAFGSGDDLLRFRDGDPLNCRGLWMMMNGLKTGMLTIADVRGAYPGEVMPWNVGEDSEFTHLHLTGDATITHINAGIPCFLRGTLIRLANGQDKPIEEITYDDELLVWDFDNGKFASAKPLWIKKPQIAPYYFRNILGNGRELLTTGKSKTGWGHRMFDIDKEMFRYTTESVADRIFTLDGIEIHKSCERIVKECEFYNIITEKHFNLFANGILTSCSLNNLYPISGMKFKKEDREFRPFEAYDVPLKYYKGLRLGEQCGDIGELTEYVKRLIDFEK